MEKPTLKILKINSNWLFAGVILVLLGYVSIAYNPMSESYIKTTFAWHKLTLAPVLLIAGYFCLGFSILKSKKS